LVIVEPPVELAAKYNNAPPFSGEEVINDGAEGTVLGVTETELDATDAPLIFTAFKVIL